MSTERGRPHGRLLVALVALVVFGIFMGAGGASAATPKALINGDSVSGGASSREAMEASSQGYAVTVVGGATWMSMSQADFGQYDLLIIGDPYCSGLAGSVTASAPVWAPVVMGTAGGRTLPGNRILIGTDPVLHGRYDILHYGMKFAGKQPGRTGLYLDTTCDYSDHVATLAMLTLLKTGSGSWTESNAAPCGGNVSLIASEPSFVGLTSAMLAGWGCSVHETFPTFPTDWSPLAVATDSATKPSCGVDPNTGANACGEAYILIAGSSIVVASGSISVAPLTHSSVAGGSHTVTAHVTSGGSPLVGQVVTWTVTGQNAGVPGVCAPAGCVTDANGDVSFTYADANGAGSDTIKASFTDAAHSLQAATAAQTWTAPADADLAAVSKTASAEPVLHGSTFSYSVKVVNNGAATATGVKVTDTLPAGLSFVSGTDCSAVAQVVTCSIGTLTVTSTATATFTVSADSVGTFTDTAAVSGSQADLTPGNNSASATTTVLPVADLAVVSKTDSADPVLNGDTFSYTVNVTNNGLDAATNVVVTDTLPAGLSFVSGTDCSAGGQVVSCTVGALAAGASAAVTFSVKATASGTFTDTATVAGDEADTVPGNNSATESTTVNPVADLAVTKTGTASLYWGQDATYTVTVTNNGPDAATAVEVTDSIAGPGTFVSGTAAGGACTSDAALLVHCPVGAIAVGDSSTVTLVVSGVEPGTIVDKAHAQGAEVDTATTNDAATASTEVLAHPTSIVYSGDTTQDYNDVATLSAKLVDTVTSTVLSGKTVDFALGAQSCTDATSGAGVATCTIVPNQAAGSYPLSATYAGGFLYVGSIDTGTFTVTKEETVTVYTGATAPVQNGTTLTLSATLKEDGVTALAGRTVTLTLGSGASAQSCTDVTNAAGQASCTILVNQAAGGQQLKASFAGDAFYVASSDTTALTVYTARSIKQGALDATNALIALTPPKGKKWDDDEDNKLSSVAKSISRSLNPAYWVDGTHLTLNGCGVFDNEARAAQKLRDLLKQKKNATPVNAAQIQAIIDQLLAADKILAQVAINEATAGGGNAKKLAYANKAMAAAAALIAAGRPAEAINAYRIAWEKAQESLGRKVCDDDGHEDEDGHEGGHHDRSSD